MRTESGISSNRREQNPNTSRLVLLLIILSVFLTCCSGCISIPGMPTGQDPIQNITPIPTVECMLIESFPTEMPIITPELTPTPLISTVSEWNPYEIIPLPDEVSNNRDPLKNRPSVLKTDIANNRPSLNTTNSGSVDLTGYAQGKELNITKGPFSITYAVHPKISNPLLVWVTLTVLDSWQNVTAEEGYNREYSSEETKTMTIYREGRYYLIIDGDYATVDYTLKTGDPTPVPPPVPEPVYEEY